MRLSAVVGRKLMKSDEPCLAASDGRDHVAALKWAFRFATKTADDINSCSRSMSCQCLSARQAEPCYRSKKGPLIEARKPKGAPRNLSPPNQRPAIAPYGYEGLNDNDEVIGIVDTGYRGISVDKSIAPLLSTTGNARMGYNS